MELKRNFPHLIIEVSGGVTVDELHKYFTTNIDVLSMSKLTQGYECIDFSLKISKDGRDPENPKVKFCLTTGDSCEDE